MDILLILSGFILSLILTVVYERKLRKSQNKVHFYVARDMNGELWLYMGKPIMDGDMYCTHLDKKTFALTHDLKRFNLKYEDYDYLKWEDGPVEVFLNLEN